LRETLRTRLPDARSLAPLIALVLLAFSLRLFVFFENPNIHYPDEIFQVTEPAHKLLFGTGFQAWEWVVGARSWLWPGVVAGLMALGRLGGSDPAAIMLPVSVFMAAASTLPVICGYLWGRRLGGMQAALIVGALNAVWVDLVYLAVHPSTDVIAADCLVWALYLGYPARPAETRGRLFWAGLLAGATFVLRIQLAPALAVIAFFVCGLRQGIHRWTCFATGALVPVLILGAVDWMTLGVPFHSIFVNVRLNVFEGVSTDFGVFPWYTFFVLFFDIWGGAFPLAILAIVAGARRLPAVAIVAATIFVTASLFAHKEYRFVFPAIPLLVTMAGLGVSDGVALLQKQRLPMFSSQGSVAMIALAFCATTSFAVAASPAYLPSWTRARGFLAAFDFLSHRADICGVALYRMSVLLTPGNTGLPPQTPLYETGAATLERDAAGFNALVGWPNAVIDDARFAKTACFRGQLDESYHTRQPICVWIRAGACQPDAAAQPPVNWPARLAARSNAASTENDEEYQE